MGGPSRLLARRQDTHALFPSLDARRGPAVTQMQFRRRNLCFWARRFHWGRTFMSAELPVALAAQAPDTAIESKRETSVWIETAVAAVFTATGVLLVSFVAVMSGLV